MYKPREHSDLGELSADTASSLGPELPPHTLKSKRNYPHCFRVSTQYVRGLRPQTGFLKRPIGVLHLVPFTAELQKAVTQTLVGILAPYILSTGSKTKGVVSFGVECIKTSHLENLLANITGNCLMKLLRFRMHCLEERSYCTTWAFTIFLTSKR